mmetsp:Transcript_8525/g.16441  ORF Transcript_8525/g.16441 Transcript_8525/m.16441 type:complete len:304 (-) Transcript_8525:739-1650(-)
MTTRFFIRVAVLTASWLSSCRGQPPQDVALSTTRLQILYPPSLMKESGYEHTIAAFGAQPIAGPPQSWKGDLVYKRTNPCSYGWREDLAGGFVLADRGSCPFADMARAVQKNGGSGLVVVSNKCVCKDPDCSYSGQDCEIRLPLMATVGVDDIAIPAMLVKKQDGTTIISALQVSTYAGRVEMEYSIPSSQTSLLYSITTDIGDAVSESFLSQLGGLTLSLGPYTVFSPKYAIWPLTCEGDENCDDTGSCTNFGRYCADGSEVINDGRPSGPVIVAEILNRLCLWQEYGDENYGQKWFVQRLC